MALYFNVLRLPYFFLSTNCETESIPEIINNFVKAPKDKPKSQIQSRPNWGYPANSVDDDMSDKSSLSGRSDHSNHSNHSQIAYMDAKIFNIIRGRSGSRKSSTPSDNQSTKSSTKNPSLKKMFATYIEDFRSENINKGQKSTENKEHQNEQKKPPIDPSFRARLNKK